MWVLLTGLIVLTNGVILIIQTWMMEEPSSSEAQEIYAPWVSYFFVGCKTYLTPLASGFVYKI